MFVGLNIQSDALTDSVRTCIDDEIVIYLRKEKEKQNVIYVSYLYRICIVFRIVFVIQIEIFNFLD
jgi:hypothetical protein